MGFLELLLIAVGLSMDAFAISMCKGLKMVKLNIKHGLIISLFFGGFQMLMPIVGWLLGVRFERYITSFDHWIAFLLLSVVGIKMIKDSFAKDEDECDYNCEK